MKLDSYITKVTTDISKGIEAARAGGVNVTPHLHEDLRGGKSSLPYGNTHHLLLPVEIEVQLDERGETAGSINGIWASIKANLSFARRHRAKLTYWIELKPAQER